jgi:hypothetical protein
VLLFRILKLDKKTVCRKLKKQETILMMIDKVTNYIDCFTVFK